MAYVFNPFTGSFVPGPTFPGALVIAAGKTVTINNTLTIASTDGITMTTPTSSFTAARTDAANTFIGAQTLAPGVGATALTVTGAIQVTDFPILDLAQTWNASGTTFTLIKAVATTTASAAASLLLDLQAGSSPASVFNVDKTGNATITTNAKGYTIAVSGQPIVGITRNGTLGGLTIHTSGIAETGSGSYAFTNGELEMASTTKIVWSTSSLGQPASLIIGINGAATMQLGSDVNGAAVAQTLQAANGITGTDKTGGNFTLASGKGTGAGAVSSLIFQTPTVLGSGTTAQSLATRLTLSSAGATFAAGITLLGGAVLLTTSSALTDGVGASAGTITNAPSVGNPTKWIGINDNGTTRYIPAW